MESTLGILLDGYTYFSTKFNQNNTDIFKTRLLLKKTIAIRGQEAAKVFYDQDKFIREGATPKRFQKTLFGEGGVQGLDNEEHLHRKELFMQCMSKDSILKLNLLFEDNWKQAMQEWKAASSILLFKEVEEVLTKSACEWIQIPLKEEEIELRKNQLSLMIDSAGAIGVRHYNGRVARDKGEKWLEKIIEETRNYKLNTEKDSILHAFCFHRNIKGELLDKNIVAVELLNLVRPIVAIARYIVFSALALHQNPEYEEKLKNGPEELYRNFVQEVRRFYPFFPFVAAKVKHDFQWKKIEFPEGTRVLLDLYATNHDDRVWEKPYEFNPERFKNWNQSPFNFIPQGGGDHYHNHRCAGEWITIQLTQTALQFLIEKMDYTVPNQDLAISKNRFPAIPKSRFIISFNKVINEINTSLEKV